MTILGLIVGFLFSDVFSRSDMSDGLGPQQRGSLWGDLVVLFLSASGTLIFVIALMNLISAVLGLKAVGLRRSASTAS